MTEKSEAAVSAKVTESDTHYTMKLHISKAFVKDLSKIASIDPYEEIAKAAADMLTGELKRVAAAKTIN